MELVKDPKQEVDGPSLEQTAKEYPLIRIEPPKNWNKINLRELFGYLDLIFILIWREIKIRYKQTFVGSAWAVIQPFVSMVVFTLLFDNVMDMPTGDIPYPVFSFCALVPWTFFTHALTKTSACLVENKKLLEKVYFPRLIYPLAATLGGLVDFCIAFVILIFMLFYYGIVPDSALMLFPLFFIMNILAVLSLGLWFSAINVQYRDIMNIMPFFIQILLFATPVAYSSSIIPEEWRILYGLNPMAGVVEGFRWTLLGAGEPPVEILITSASTTIVLLISGLFFYRKREDFFVDII